MGRNKRFVRSDGMMICKPIKEDPVTWHAVHILDFYRAPVTDGVYWTDPETGIQFGRPSGYCKDCQKNKAKGYYQPKRTQWNSGDEAEVFKEYDSEVEALDEEPVARDPDWPWDDPRWETYDKRGG